MFKESVFGSDPCIPSACESVYREIFVPYRETVTKIRESHGKTVMRLERSVITTRV